MLIFNREIDSRWLMMGGAILAVLLIFALLSIRSCQKPDDMPASIAAVKKALEEKYNGQLEEKDTLLEQKDIAIVKRQEENNALRVKIAISEEKNKTLAKRYNDLKEAYSNVTLPKSDTELRDRYSAAGFVPVPVGVCGAGYICFPTGYK